MNLCFYQKINRGGQQSSKALELGGHRGSSGELDGQRPFVAWAARQQQTNRLLSIKQWYAAMADCFAAAFALFAVNQPYCSNC